MDLLQTFVAQRLHRARLQRHMTTMPNPAVNRTDLGVASPASAAGYLEH